MGGMTERVEPPKTPTPQADPDLQAAVDALDDVEATAATINFGDGVSINPLTVNGLEEYRLEVASGGKFSSVAEIGEALTSGSLAAMGALYWLARLRADGLTQQPSKAPYSFEDCLEAIDMQSMTEVMKRFADADPPT